MKTKQEIEKMLTLLEKKYKKFDSKSNTFKISIVVSKIEVLTWVLNIENDLYENINKHPVILQNDTVSDTKFEKWLTDYISFCYNNSNQSIMNTDSTKLILTEIGKEYKDKYNALCIVYNKFKYGQ